MKKISALATAAVAVVLSGCSENNEPQIIPEAEGKEVNFSLAMPGQSRTYYDPTMWWDEDKTYTDIFWGDIMDANATEKVVVYGNFEGRNRCAYTVGGYSVKSNTATTLTKIGDTGVQWGAQPASGAKVHFYSVYPYVSDDYITQSAVGELCTELTNGQSAKSYSLVAGDKSSIMEMYALQAASMPSAARTMVANPDMSAAVMIADTEVEYGAASVPLEYKMLPNVLEVTINGPAADLINGVNDQFVDILNVIVKAKDNTTPVAGRFTYNATTGDIAVTNGQAIIQMQTSITQNNVVYHPRLYRYADGTYDKLKVRFFILPGIQASDLEIDVTTSRGYYQVNPENVAALPDFQTGKIHRVKLPLFDTDGLHEFDYSNWMDQIAPNVYVTELSIPGSWESFSTTYQVGDYKAQYKAGIRAFNLRPQGRSSNTNTTNIDQSSTAFVMVEGAGTGTSGELNTILNYLGEQLASTQQEFCVVNLRGLGLATNSSDYTVNPAAVRRVLDGNDYVYKGEITPETTVSDVAKKIIIRINADGTVNMPAADAKYPALFAKWDDGTRSTVKVEPLDWGQWTSSGETGAGNTGLNWCFSEEDHIVSVSDASSSRYPSYAMRQQALDAYIEQSLVEYQRGEHDTWFYFVIGGDYGTMSGSTYNLEASGYATVASTLNSYAYAKLSDPARQACPMGMVMMNYASSTDAKYNSANLIRTIVNNNNAFIMNKKPSSN